MTLDLARRPAPDEAARFYHGYIDLVPDGDVLATLDRQLDETAALVADTDGQHRYAPGKWTVNEVLLHVADTERVFAYRALRFARGDGTPLPGFHQDVFARSVDLSDRSVGELMADVRAARAATLSLARSFDASAWDRVGTASGHPMTTRAAIWTLAGHERHHRALLRERYLSL